MSAEEAHCELMSALSPEHAAYREALAEEEERAARRRSAWLALWKLTYEVMAPHPDHICVPAGHP
jgi:hypothetical protein